MKWVKASTRPPNAPKQGKEMAVCSIDVLITNGKETWVGFFKSWPKKMPTGIWKDYWKTKDGFSVEGVTHWMLIPKLPCSKSPFLKIIKKVIRYK